MPPAEFECVVCGQKTLGSTFRAKEIMFGDLDEFDYAECAACGSLQLQSVPSDSTKYYRAGYYSFSPRPGLFKFAEGAVYRTGTVFERVGHRAAESFSWIPARLFRNTSVWRKMESLGMTRRSAVLDVGCGSGGFLRQLRLLGYRNLTGVDPYLPNEHNEPGIKLLRRSIFEIEGAYDLINFGHSLEHMPDPRAALRRAASLLVPGGKSVISIPVASSFAWRHYRENWVQLDSPRHLFVPSVQGLHLLASHAGLEVVDLVYESTEFQFWGSEQHLRGIPLLSPRSYAVDPRRSIFSKDDIARFRERARLLNEQRDGDTVRMVLRRPPT